MTDTEPDLQAAFDLYLAGQSQVEVAKQFGFSSSTFARRLKSADIPIRTQADSHRLRADRADEALLAQFSEAVRRYEDGEPALWLAKEYGIGYKKFIGLLIRMGVQPRTIRENLAVMYARMTPEERKQVAAAAQTAKRGRPANLMSMERRAQTMERTLQLASRFDLLLGLWLAQRGLQFIPQKAVGRYNIDIAVMEPRIVVEVNGPGHWSGKEKWIERCQYLFGQGWRVIEIRIRKGPISTLRETAADRVISLVEQAREPWPAWGDCVAINGHGELLESADETTA